MENLHKRIITNVTLGWFTLLTSRSRDPILNPILDSLLKLLNF